MLLQHMSLGVLDALPSRNSSMLGVPMGTLALCQDTRRSVCKGDKCMSRVGRPRIHLDFDLSDEYKIPRVSGFDVVCAKYSSDMRTV